MPLILTREDEPRGGAARAVFDPEVYPDKSEIRGDRISVNPGSADGEDLRMACVRAMECALVQGFERIFFSARDSVVSGEALADAVKAAAPPFLENGWLTVILRCPDPELPAGEERSGEEVLFPVLRERIHGLLRRVRRFVSGREETPEKEKTAAPEETDLDAFLRARREEGFAPAFLRRLEEKGLSDGELCRRANLDRRTLARLREDPDFRPDRQTAAALALALALPPEDARALLARAGVALSPGIPADLVFTWYLERGISDVLDVNETLFRLGLPQLGPVD